MKRLDWSDESLLLSLFAFIHPDIPKSKSPWKDLFGGWPALTHLLIPPPSSWASIMRSFSKSWDPQEDLSEQRVLVVRALGRLNCRVEDHIGTSSLHEAVMAASPLRPDMIRALVEVGCDPNARKYGSSTALHLAADQKCLSLDVLKALLQCGADPAAKDSYDWTVLMRLAKSDATADPQVVDVLLKSGCPAACKGRYLLRDLQQNHECLLRRHKEWLQARRQIDEESSHGTSIDVDWTH